MTNKERKDLMALASKAEVLQKIWLREREEQRAMQVTANTEIRRRWFELDSVHGKSGVADQHNVAAEQTGDGSHHSRPRKEKRP